MAVRQKVILVLGLALAGFMVLFAPFVQPIPVSQGGIETEFLGYYFLFTGPPSHEAVPGLEPEVHIGLLLGQMVVIFMLTIYGIYLARNRSESANARHGAINKDRLSRDEIAKPML